MKAHQYTLIVSRPRYMALFGKEASPAPPRASRVGRPPCSREAKANRFRARGDRRQPDRQGQPPAPRKREHRQSVEPSLIRSTEACPRAESLLCRYTAVSQGIGDPAQSEYRATRAPEDSTGMGPEPRTIWPPTHEPHRRCLRNSRIPARDHREKRRSCQAAIRPVEKIGWWPAADVRRRLPAAAR